MNPPKAQTSMNLTEEHRGTISRNTTWGWRGGGGGGEGSGFLKAVLFKRNLAFNSDAAQSFKCMFGSHM